MADTQTPAPVLRIAGITKRFGDLVVNQDITLQLAAGEVLALLGENGAGKSTLMSILFGHYLADAGYIEIHGQRLKPGDTKAALAAGIGMVHQHFALAENLTVLENVLIGSQSLLGFALHTKQMREKLMTTASAYGLEIDCDAKVSSLSMGGRQRVEILKALTRGAKVLILDEPTAILTPQESESLFATLEGFVEKGLSIVFISHKLNEVMRVSDRVAVLRAGRLVAERMASQTSAAELASLMVGREVDHQNVPPKAIEKTAQVVLNVKGLEFRQGAVQRLHPLSFQIRAGEILGIAGVSGNGQSDLADLLSCVLAPSGGVAELCGKSYPLGKDRAAQAIAHGIARIPEDRTYRGVVGDASVAENIFIGRYSTGIFIRLRERAQQSKAITQQFDVRHNGLHKPARALSGGNIQKLVLGRELGLSSVVKQASPVLIIANQPTWGLDVGAVAYVHDQLRKASDAGAAILLISDELEEIFALSHGVAVMFKGALSEVREAGAWNRQEIGLAMAGMQYAA